MDWNAGSLVVFSPTGSTRAVVEAVAQGWGLEQPRLLDLTRPEAGADMTQLPATQVTIIGAPVYVGRVAPAARARLRRLRSVGGPALVVVVYGNREFEDALLELRDLAREQGFRPVAAGAFIGEHSFSTPATPIAMGRPDSNDLALARSFGQAARTRLETMPHLETLPVLQVPGNHPYREVPQRPGASPSTNEPDCALCAACVAACPMAAISLGERIETDVERCILCCACIRSCDTGARRMLVPPVLQCAENLSTQCRERKEPETFLLAPGVA